MSNALLTPEAPALPVEKTTASHRKPQLPALTGVRTLLAINIVLFHFTPPHLGPLYKLVDNSYVFVGYFILLSGFVLSYNYADRPRLDKRHFWRARFARLYPIYLLSLVISIVMLDLEWHARPHGQFLTGVILTPLLLQGWSPQLATFWNTVAWTLSCEAAFYLAFPYIVKLPWPRSAAKLAGVGFMLWAVGLVPHLLYLHFNPDHLSKPANRYSSGLWIRTLKYTPMAYFCTFLAGVALGKIQNRLVITERVRAAIAGVSLGSLWIFFAYIVKDVPYILMHGGLLVPLFAALTVGLAGRNIFAAVFAWKPIELLGQASYALFLLHFNFLNLLRRYHVTQHLHVAAWDPWISYVATIAFSVAAMYWVERPARKLILDGSQPTK